MLDLAAAVQDAVGAEVPLVFLPLTADDPVRRRPDVMRMRQRYDWQPKVLLADGLRRTAAHFRALRRGRLLAAAA